MTMVFESHREALGALLESGGREVWIATARLDGGAVDWLIRRLTKQQTLRVLVDASPDRVADGEVDLAALHRLRSVPGCEVRHLSGLASSVYATAPDGQALVTSAPLTLSGLDGPQHCGLITPDAAAVTATFGRWWELAVPLTDVRWVDLTIAASTKAESRTLGEEIARVGAFVRVSVKGTRRTRRLDPKEYGVVLNGWGRAVRPVEVSLYKLDEVIRAREELEAVLAEKGLEWNGYYLVPRVFLERDWPRLFAARERSLRERLESQEGRAALKEQLAAVRQELEAFFGGIYPQAESDGLTAEHWVNQETTRILTEAVSDSILAEGGLDYRVLTIIPEDSRSMEEIHAMLDDPKLRSVQLTFPFS